MSAPPVAPTIRLRCAFISDVHLGTKVGKFRHGTRVSYVPGNHAHFSDAFMAQPRASWSPPSSTSPTWRHALQM